MKPDLNQLFADSNLILELTNDGSPTLRVKSSQESMHHFDGAASETWYVYGSVLELALNFAVKNNAKTFHVASVGLGLGYVELCWALLLNNHLGQIGKLDTRLDSFEILNPLKNEFLNWVRNEKNEFSALYDLVLSKLKATSPTATIKATDVKQIIKTPQFHFHSDLLKFSDTRSWNFICFDAFSKNTDSHLWAAEFLNGWLVQYAAQDCVFTTYAATSILKKVLLKNNFTLIHRLGYSGKRECTLAVRGKFKDDFATSQIF